MKRLFYLLGIASMPCLAMGQGSIPDPTLGIIPAPVTIKHAAGRFSLGATVYIKVDRGAAPEVRWLITWLRQHGYKVSTGDTSSSLIELTTTGIDGLPEEGYRLTVSAGKILIAGKGAGLFYGIQTLLQLLSDKKEVPCVTIEDYPRLAYRGMLLDVGRHFFTVEAVKAFIDRMATYKLNRFQWHLTDNEGWRIEIKKYPKLTQVGAYRMQSEVAGNRDWPDSVRYGGYYTQDQIREVVRYAADRHIVVIPEIEMPSHSGAALQAYPSMKCPLDTSAKMDWAFDVLYCPTEETFQFLQDVLTEVIALFPSKYIHIGGDEAEKIPWVKSTFCQDLIRKNGLKDEKGLQSYFIQRIEQFLLTKGRNIIGWDEILEGGLAPNATVMSWRGEEGGIAAAQQHHQVIMSPSTNGMYLDYAQSRNEKEPVNIGGYTPLQQTYDYNPIPASLPKEQQQYIVGVQGNVWTEFIGTPAKIEYMTLPRMYALAEVAWSLVSQKDFADFAGTRVPQHLTRLDHAGVNYRVPVAIGVADSTVTVHGASFHFALRPPLPGAKIYYTLNDREPGDTDWEYSSPLDIAVPRGETRVLRTIVITPAGRRSVPTRTIMVNTVK
jgi:hexosaminidase